MTDNNELLQAMNTLLAKASAQNAAPVNPSPWAQPAPSSSPALIQGVGVPVKIGRGRGTLRLYLWLPAECAASPATLNAALDDLERAGLPLDTWEPKDSGWSASSRSTWRR